jgi:signal transduction histidine kinase
MNSMLGRVESASARQQQFVDDASHELRTPLTRMVTDLDLAIAHPDDEPALTTLRRLHEHATDLRQLLHDLLYVARISQDRVAAHNEVDLDDIAIRAARELRARSMLTVDTTGVAAARVLGDGRELDRAIRNLLDNAGRHARTLVAISTSTGDGFCHVVIDDDGTGVPRADRDRIFERFTRLDEARSRTDGGAGLGLAIVSDIATRHRGQVTVDDAPTGGARFILAIPTGDS